MLQLPPEEWCAYRARLRDLRNAGWLTANRRDVLAAIADLTLAGDDMPTTAKIAVYAGTSPRTVRRGLADAKSLGLLVVETQFHMIAGKRQQGANRYVLVLPSAPVVPKPRISRGGQSGRPRGLSVERKRLRTGVSSGGGGQNLLEARVQAFRALQMAQMERRLQ